MIITRITEETKEYFSHLLPQGGMQKKDQLIGVIADEEAAAACVLEAAGRRAILKWLYVDPEKRRRGAAQMLIHDLSFYLRDSFDALEISFLSEMEGMEEFLGYMGFFLAEGDPVYVLPMGELLDRAGISFSSEEKKTEQIAALSSLDREQKRKVLQLFSSEAIAHEFIDDADESISYCRLDDKNEPKAALLLKKINDDIFRVQYFISALGEVQTGQFLRDLLRKTRKLGLERKYLQFVSALPGAQSFSRRLVGKDDFEPTYLHVAVLSLRGAL